MTRRRVLLGVASALVLLASTAWAQGVGVFVRASCTTLNSAQAGKTFCFEQDSNTLKFYDGTSWRSQGLTGTPSILNLKDFNAKGDGSTDDSTAISNWLAAANVLGTSGITGNMLYVPPGTYNHTNTTEWPNKGLTVLCASDALSTFRYTGGATGNTLNNDGSTYPLVFENCGFSSTTTSHYILDFWKPGRLTMINPRIRAEGGAPTGFRIRGNAGAAQQTTLINPYISGNLIMHSGLVLEGTTLPGVTTTTILGGRIDQTTTNGIRLSTVQGVSILGTNIEGHAVGVFIDGARAIQIRSPWFESNTGADVRIAAATTSAVGVLVDGAHFASSTVPYNLDIQSPATSLESRGHRFVHNAVTASPTGSNVRVQSGARDTTIAFNTFSNAPEIEDYGTCTNRIGNIFADGTSDYVVPCGALRVGTSSTLNTGTGTTNNASATHMNGQPALVASTASINAVNILGISASHSRTNNLRGTCNFAASVTCQVAFGNNEIDAHYYVITSGLVNVTTKTRNGFTLTATGTNSNTIDWFLVR